MKDKKLKNINNSGFKTPKSYFANLEYQIMSHVKINKVKTTGLKMPEDYLDSFDNKVLEKISKSDNTKAINLFSKRNLIYISGIAAAVIIFFSLGIFSTSDPYSKLEDSLVENYVINEISDLDLALLLEDQEIHHTEFIDYNLNEDILDQYLQSTDIEELITE